MRNLFIIGTLVLAAAAIIGCGSSGPGAGEAMPDNAQVRTQNPTSQRPTIGVGGASGGQGASAKQAPE